MFSWEQDKENLKTAGGSIAGIFGGLGSYLGPNHKVLAFSLAGIGILFLIGTIVLQMQNRTHASKVTHGLIALATVTFIYFGYNEARRPAAAPTTPSSLQQQQNPATATPVVTALGPVTNSAETKETRSPAVAGNNNTVIYSDGGPGIRKKKK